MILTPQQDDQQQQMMNAKHNKDDLDDVEEPSISSSSSQGCEKQTSTDLPNDNGKIFGYLLCPILLAGFIHYVMHLYTFIKKHTWGIVSMAYIVNEDVEHKEDSALGSTLLTIHALVAIFLMYLTVSQVLSGLMATLEKEKKKDEHPSPSTVRSLHVRMGRPVAALWVVTILSGFVYLNSSELILHKEREENGAEHTAFALVFIQVAGIAMLLNLYNGIRAVSHANKADRDYILHKGSMFFVVYYAGGNLIGQLLLQILQVTVFRDRDLTYGLLTITVITITMTCELSAYVYVGYRWGGDACRRPFVRYNMFVVAFIWIGFWTGTIGIWVQERS